MTRVVILTGSELRHTFFRKFLAGSDGIDVVGSYCEGLEKSLAALLPSDAGESLRARHIANRAQSEVDFFGLFVEQAPDRSQPVFLPKGEINSAEHTRAILDSRPDLLVAYGCS